jgi:hypothetical protein
MITGHSQAMGQEQAQPHPAGCCRCFIPFSYEVMPRDLMFSGRLLSVNLSSLLCTLLITGISASDMDRQLRIRAGSPVGRMHVALTRESWENLVVEHEVKLGGCL